jgi:biotin carboxyl carrier protein
LNFQVFSLGFSLEKEEQDKGIYKSHMSGKVTKIRVKIGDIVKKGTILLIMESMKMETTIESLADGVVEQIFVKEGLIVNEGEPLLFVKRVVEK